MSAPFKKQMIAGWADMDFNAHMRNTAYLDRASDVRMMFFSEHGFDPAEFKAQLIGPVVREDRIRYYREINLQETFSVCLRLAGLAENGSQFKFRNEFKRADGELAARVYSVGGWLDLSRRKLIVPPKALFDTISCLEKTDDFEVLSSSVK